MGIFAGTSGWAYSSWKPDFYPHQVAAKKFLEYYATQLNSVEVNYTFRQLPSESMLADWLAASGADFTFSFKAPQRITHFSRLKNCDESIEAFFTSLTPVFSAKRLGVVLFQLPPNFKTNAELLDQFLAGAQRKDFRLACEFRHESWFSEESYIVLKRHKAALCVAESEKLESPDVETAPFRCYRLRKPDYSPADLDRLTVALKTRAKEGDLFVYFKHEEAPTGALNAVRLLQRLRAA
jgi:uncharacterized protein YecE (DUF72 family)